jgi:serine/threonine protein kinase
VLAGAPSDVLSDVFSFGAVVYEMLSGRHAFDGDSPEALAKAIAESQPTSCGPAAIDGLIQTCLAKDRGARFQRMEKILLELKLAAIAGRLGQLPAVARWETVAVRLENDLRDAQRSLALQAAAIDSFRAEMKRNESLLGWVVDILEVLQTNALDPTQGVAAANGNSSWPEVAGTRRDSSVAEVHQMHRSADEFAA